MSCLFKISKVGSHTQSNLTHRAKLAGLISEDLLHGATTMQLKNVQTQIVFSTHEKIQDSEIWDLEA